MHDEEYERAVEETAKKAGMSVDEYKAYLQQKPEEFKPVVEQSDAALCAELLKRFHIAEDVLPQDIKNLKIHKSQSYALQNVFAFDYEDKHYYIVDDYSLGDDPKLVESILMDINHLLKGRIVKNPEPSDDKDQYVASNYYLWQSPIIA
jgi:hypothetical protein